MAREATGTNLANIRKATFEDVPALLRLISHYAARSLMLPRTLAELYENLREFTVVEEDGVLAGCGSLKFYSDKLAEIRSLGVEPGEGRRGVGGALTEALLDEAERLGLKTVFALTLAPEFFLKHGFRKTARTTLPMKIWRDCIRCEKFFHCDEKTVVVDLPRRVAASAHSRFEASEIPV